MGALLEDRKTDALVQATRELHSPFSTDVASLVGRAAK